MTSQTRRDSVASHHSTSQTSQTARECVSHLDSSALYRPTN